MFLDSMLGDMLGDSPENPDRAADESSAGGRIKKSESQPDPIWAKPLPKTIR